MCVYALIFQLVFDKIDLKQNKKFSNMMPLDCFSPPPFWKARYGNLHTFPKPTAYPHGQNKIQFVGPVPRALFSSPPSSSSSSSWKNSPLSIYDRMLAAIYILIDIQFSTTIIRLWVIIIRGIPPPPPHFLGIKGSPLSLMKHPKGNCTISRFLCNI